MNSAIPNPRSKPHSHLLIEQPHAIAGRFSFTRSSSAEVTNAHTLPPTLLPGHPITALAPMQDVTDLPFMRIIAGLGPPDYFFTEYFRVHVHSRLEKHILDAILHHQSGRPVFAQMIGNDPDLMVHTAQQLRHYPIAGIDLNMGCPAPKVYKKNAGGGLLRNLPHVDRLLGRLRDSIDGLFTVKMRIGFDQTDGFPDLLALIQKHSIDLLSLHGRTVKEMYRSEVHYDFIAHAVRALKCPVLANGNISSVPSAFSVLRETRAAGIMIGRAAIRNPWIFRQLREAFEKNTSKPEDLFQPTLQDVYHYIENLWQATTLPGRNELYQVARMKKFLNFIGLSVDPEGQFLHHMRRTKTRQELFSTCAEFLTHSRAQLPFSPEPFPHLIARPSRESNTECRLT